MKNLFSKRTYDNKVPILHNQANVTLRVTIETIQELKEIDKSNPLLYEESLHYLEKVLINLEHIK